MVGGYLSTGDVDRCYDVCSVSIKASDAAGHGRAHQVLVDVQLHQSGCAAFQHLHKRQRVVSVRHTWFKYIYKQIWCLNCLVRVVFTSLTTLAGTVASHTADFPRPMIQFMAADFLSVQ